jgi:hypothetical protein
MYMKIGGLIPRKMRSGSGPAASRGLTILSLAAASWIVFILASYALWTLWKLLAG